MLIIGLHNAEDSGVCLVRNGVLLEAVNEERFSRSKLHYGPPRLALEYLLRKYSIELSDIDWFAYGWHAHKTDYVGYATRLSRRIIALMKHNPGASNIIEQRLQVEFERDARTRNAFDAWMAELNIPADRIAYLDHHGSHAWAAYACSPFERSLIVTMDGRGDLKSNTVSLASGKDIRELDYDICFDSLGFLYGQITHYLGYMPHRHEGKVTGLAAHGNPDATLPLMRSLIDWHDGGIRAKFGPYKPFYTDIDPDLVAQLDQHTREDIAAGVQRHCEELVVRYVRYWLNKLGDEAPRHVCLAGGLFANVRINQCVAEIKGVDDVYVFPHMGDGGLSVGAAAALLKELTGQVKLDMPTVLLGPCYDDSQIEDALAKFADRICVERPAKFIDSVVGLLSSGKVVGWFEGRMEFGPRALGARSILHQARDAKVNDWLNKRLRRTEFMPFAPVTPERLAAECYIDWHPSQVCAHFMTRTYDCSDDFSSRHPAVVHIDGTARPQIVRSDHNGDYFKVVDAYCSHTGDKALINTSFNQHEEPIVCSPEDAIGSLLNDNIDVLAIAGRLVTIA